MLALVHSGNAESTCMKKYVWYFHGQEILCSITVYEYHSSVQSMNVTVCVCFCAASDCQCGAGGYKDHSPSQDEEVQCEYMKLCSSLAHV